MAKNVEVTRKKNESNASILKRFGRKVQESGALKVVRKKRFASRSVSDYVKKKNKMKSLKKNEEIQTQIKLGKMSPKGHGRK